MAKFRPPKKLFGKRKMVFLMIALVLLFALWFFFLRGGREGFREGATDFTTIGSESDCKTAGGTWDDKQTDSKKKCAAAVAQASAATTQASSATASAVNAVNAAQQALASLSPSK